MTSIKHQWFLGALLLVLSARPGSAATIDIVSGSLVFTSPSAGHFHLVGAERGLVFDGSVDTSGAHSFPRCLPCPVGAIFHIDISQDFNDLRGAVTLDGVTHAVGTSPTESVAGAYFSGPGFIIPPLGGDQLVLTSPFLFQGFFREQHLNFVGEHAHFAGSGVATFTFIPWPVSPGNAWLLQSARYDIVPEPAAVWLLLTGLTGIGGRRLLRRTI